MLVIDASTSPDKVGAITDALVHSALGVNPQVQGSLIYVALPKMTRQHREELAKSARNLYNKCVERLRR